MIRLVALVGATLLVGVGTGCDLELPSEHVLDRTRLLAARSDPAQPAVGDVVSISSYAWSPSGPPMVVWCLPTGCDPTDPGVAEAAALSDPLSEEAGELRGHLADVGIIGVEPGLPVMAPAYDVGDGSMVLLAFAVPPEGNDIEEATLTLPLRVDDAAPNLHPRIASVRMDDDPVDDIVLAPEAEALLTVDLDPLAEEELDDDADVQWFTTVEESQGGGPGGRPGGFLGDDSLTLSSESKHQGVVVVVVRDGRGGVDWRELPVVVR